MYPDKCEKEMYGLKIEIYMMKKIALIRNHIFYFILSLLGMISKTDFS